MSVIFQAPVLQLPGVIEGSQRKPRSEDSHLRLRYKLGSPEYEAAVLKFAPSTCISSHDIKFQSFHSLVKFVLCATLLNTIISGTIYAVEFSKSFTLKLRHATYASTQYAHFINK
jgi:hypothetical protein